jgi:Transposase Tn5 dimerisation domain/Transposase DNA-binding
MHKITVKDFPHLNFGDIRRDERFVTIINNISDQPGSSIPKQNKRWYDTKATYAFFKNKDVSIEELKKALMLYGAKKIADEMTVLIAHDISNISYNDLQAEGLGYLDNKEGQGILCYSSIAATTDGLPLSLLYQHTWTRPHEELGKSNKRKQLSFEEKESYRWYEGMSKVNQLLGEGVHKIHIADREADIYELFFHAYESNTDLLIRARHNRSLLNGSHLWDNIAEQPVTATVSLDIPDKTGKKKLKAEAAVRYHEVEILRPSNNKHSYESVVLTAIEIKEKDSGGKAEEDLIQWKLLTTMEVKSVSDALQCVKWYTYRWLIERFHYVLKSGTKIEELQLKDAESLQKAIAVYSMAAFRVMQLVYESRHHPEVSCEVVLTKAQWKTLYMLIHGNNQIPKQPPSLQQAVMWIGRLGGHLGRKSDGPPGLKTVWQGYQQLCHAASVYELMTQKI